MKAHELREYLLSLDSGWVDREKTVDTFKAGDPEAEVRGIAVGWMSYTWALQQALELGCNVFVTHEPTFYDHYDRDSATFDLPGVCEKQAWIEENKLVILRCHDLWDQFPGTGIPDSWGDLLGLRAPSLVDGYFRAYDVERKTALEIARQVAKRTRPLGQEAVQLIGPADRLVTRVGIGTGAITPAMYMIQHYNVDLPILTDDGLMYWREGAYAIDMGIPCIVVHHHVSEEAGIMNLARHLKDHFPNIPVHHIPQKCMFKLVK